MNKKQNLLKLKLCALALSSALGGIYPLVVVKKKLRKKLQIMWRYLF